jgi:hypothetical protein
VIASGHRLFFRTPNYRGAGGCDPACRPSSAEGDLARQQTRCAPASFRLQRCSCDQRRRLRADQGVICKMDRSDCRRDNVATLSSLSSLRIEGKANDGARKYGWNNLIGSDSNPVKAWGA